MADSHIIYRQILDISFSSKEEALNMQDEIRQIYYRELLPLINEIFDEFLADGEFIRIDSLEIDLGRVNSKHLKEDFKEKVRKDLMDKLMKIIPQQRPSNKTSHSLMTSLVDSLSDGVSIRSGRLSELELFIYFSKFGRLPWWARKNSFEFEKITLNLFKYQVQVFTEALKPLTSDQKCVKRFIYQLSDTVLEKLILLQANVNAGQLLSLLKEIQAIQQHQQIFSLSKSNIRQVFWQSAFQFYGTDFDRNKLQKLFHFNSGGINDFIKKNAPDYIFFLLMKLTPFFYVQNDDRYSRNLALLKKIQITLKEIKLPNSTVGVVINYFKKIREADYKKAIQSSTTPSEADERIKPFKNEMVSTSFPDEESFEIQNAGLILVAPFLTVFFEELGLVREKKFITEDASLRAALILQFLVTKETEFSEHDLVLNKLLCGLPLDTPLPPRLEISKLEKKEVENLLNSIANHWTALKGTSGEGVRQTFLVKDGILSQEPNGWKLKIERSAVDILVDRLPWSISIIKLPWNEDMVYVEW